jgi:hypothetical protein
MNRIIHSLLAPCPVSIVGFAIFVNMNFGGVLPNGSLVVARI